MISKTSPSVERCHVLGTLIIKSAHLKIKESGVQGHLRDTSSFRNALHGDVAWLQGLLKHTDSSLTLEWLLLLICGHMSPGTSGNGSRAAELNMKISGRGSPAELRGYLPFADDTLVAEKILKDLSLSERIGREPLHGSSSLSP